MDDSEEFENEPEAAPDEWKDFREGEGDPIRVDDLKRLDLQNMPEDIHISVMDDYFPETAIWREGEILVGEIQEHLYTKYWEHKFSAYAFAEAMERAVRRLAHEGHPFTDPSRDDEDVHIFVRWQIKLPRNTQADVVADSIKSAFDLVWHRADTILENSDSAYAKHRHWHKLTYEDADLERAVEEAAVWAEKFVAEFADFQLTKLPWLKK